MGLPVEGSNLGFRVQSAASCQLDERASAPGPGVEPGPADPKSAVLPATPTGNDGCRSRMPAGRTRCLLVPNQAGSPLPLASGGKPRRPLGAGPVPLPGFEPGASAFVVRRSVRLSYRGVRPVSRQRTASGRRASNPLLRFGRPTCPPSSPRPQGSALGSGAVVKEGVEPSMPRRAPGLQPGGAATAPSSPCGSGGGWLPDPALVLAAGEATGTSLGNVLLRCAVVKEPPPGNGQQ